MRRARRVWAIAAIHGEADRLRAVHDELDRRFRPGDKLVYLGNYLGHGAHILETLDELLAFRRALLARPGMMACDIVFLRGAQEEMWAKLLQIHLAFNPVEVMEWMIDRGAGATLAAYGIDPERGVARARAGAVDLARWTGELRAVIQRHPGHDVLLSELRRAALTEDRGLLFVHAGLDPGRPLEAQGDTLWWGGAGFETMETPYGDFRLVVRGFCRAPTGVSVGAATATIDGGCGRGGTLNAACFDHAGRLDDLIEA